MREHIIFLHHFDINSLFPSQAPIRGATVLPATVANNNVVPHNYYDPKLRCCVLPKMLPANRVTLFLGNSCCEDKRDRTFYDVTLAS